MFLSQSATGRGAHEAKHSDATIAQYAVPRIISVVGPGLEQALVRPSRRYAALLTGRGQQLPAWDGYLSRKGSIWRRSRLRFQDDPSVPAQRRAGPNKYPNKGT